MDRKVIHQSIGLGIVLAGLLGFLLSYFLLPGRQFFGSNPSNQSLLVSEDTPVAQSLPFSEHKSTITLADSDAAAQATNVLGSSNELPENVESSVGNTDQFKEPSTRPVLSDHVMLVIAEVQARQLDDQWEEALNEMNALYTEYEDLNSFEQSTLLSFYTNTLIRLEMWQESVQAFSLMLKIENLRPEIQARALMALGQLHGRLGREDQARESFQSWLDFTSGNGEYADQRVRVIESMAALGGKGVQ